MSRASVLRPQNIGLKKTSVAWEILKEPVTFGYRFVGARKTGSDGAEHPLAGVVCVFQVCSMYVCPMKRPNGCGLDERR